MFVFYNPRYKIIKDNANLSGRGALKQWPFYGAMEELMGRDPSIMPSSVEASLPIRTFLFYVNMVVMYTHINLLCLTHTAVQAR